MALFPRMTRPAIRLTIDALQVYTLGLLPEDQQIATDTIKELQRAIASANHDNRRRAAAKKTTEQKTNEREGKNT